MCASCEQTLLFVGAFFKPDDHTCWLHTCRRLHLLYITRLGTNSTGWFLLLIRSATLGAAGVHGLPKEAPSRADVMVLSIFMPFDADKPFATPPVVTPNF